MGSILPWSAYRTVEGIGVVHFVAHPFAAFLASVEMVFAVALPCDIQSIFLGLSKGRVTGSHQHSGGFAEKMVTPALVACDHPVGRSLTSHNSSASFALVVSYLYLCYNKKIRKGEFVRWRVKEIFKKDDLV